jgi:hypothetical protein
LDSAAPAFRGGRITRLFAVFVLAARTALLLASLLTATLALLVALPGLLTTLLVLTTATALLLATLLTATLTLLVLAATVLLVLVLLHVAIAHLTSPPG